MQAALQPIESKVKKVKNNAGREASERVIRILAVTLLVSVMSATTFTIVLPEIRAEYRLTYAQVSWVTTAYLLLYAIGTVIYGKLADHYRLKNFLLTFGLIFFSFGYVMWSLVWSEVPANWRFGGMAVGFALSLVVAPLSTVRGVVDLLGCAVFAWPVIGIAVGLYAAEKVFWWNCGS